MLQSTTLTNMYKTQAVQKKAGEGSPAEEATESAAEKMAEQKKQTIQAIGSQPLANAQGAGHLGRNINLWA